MIEIGFMQSLYKKLTGKNYDINADNLHEIAEMLRKLLNKGCFDGYFMTDKIYVSHITYRKYTGYPLNYRTIAPNNSTEYTININDTSNTISFINTVPNKYAIVALSDDTALVNLKDTFLNHITTSPVCQGINATGCPQPITNIHLKLNILNGYIAPEEIIYIDKLHMDTVAIQDNIAYLTADNGNLNIYEINSSEAIFDITNATYSFSQNQKIILTINTNVTGSLILYGTITNINGTKITVKIDKNYSDEILLNTNAFAPPAGNLTFNYGVVIDKSQYPKGFVIKTSNGENILHGLEFQIYPNDNSLLEEIINDNKTKWKVFIKNYGIQWRSDAITTDTISDFEILDIDIPDGQVKEKVKLSQLDKKPILAGYSRTVTQLSEYGTKNNDLKITKYLYTGPHGHEFDNWGSFANNKEITQGFTAIIKELKNTDNYIYKIISNSKLNNLVSLFRVYPTDLDKYQIKQRLWYDLTDLDITIDTWQDCKGYIWEFKPATKTVLLHTVVKDISLENISDYITSTSDNYIMLVYDDNGIVTDTETTLPSWAQSISRKNMVDIENSTVYITWKIVIKDNELILNNQELIKQFNLYVTTKGSFDNYQITNSINIKTRFDINIVPSIMFNLNNLISQYSVKFNTANIVNGIKYPGYAKEVAMGNEEVLWITPTVTKMSDGVTITQVDDAFVDPLPEENVVDKLFVPSPYSTAIYNIEIIIKGVDTTNNSILDAIKNRLYAYITAHDMSNITGQTKEYASSISDPIVDIWTNPQTGQTENVIKFTISWTGSQLHSVAERLPSGTKIVVGLYDINNQQSISRAETNIYLPAVVNLSDTGTTDSEICTNIENINGYTYKFKTQPGITTDALSQSSIGDLDVTTTTFNITQEQQGLILKSDNILNITSTNAKIKFNGLYMQRSMPTAFGVCSDNGNLIKYIYRLPYDTRTVNDIIFSIPQTTDNNSIYTVSNVSSIQPTLVDFVYLPGEIDNVRVKNKVEALTGLKHLYYLSGTISINYNYSIDSGINVNPVIPDRYIYTICGTKCYDYSTSLDCNLPDGSLGTNYGQYISDTKLNNGDRVMLAINGLFLVGTVYNDNYIYVEVPCANI